MDGFSSFVSNLLYGNKQHRAPVEQLSFVRRMISNHQYQEALTELNSIEGDCLEVHKLKMELLYENFKALKQSLEIGIALMEAERLDYEHVEILNLCVDICLELNNRAMAILLLKKYGPQLPGKAAVNSTAKRLKALEAA